MKQNAYFQKASADLPKPFYLITSMLDFLVSSLLFAIQIL